ncbi:DNA topoisomerase IV, alpha subunit [Xylariaceae sp. AK1471]|nr:DNA topoisomerase IV, alpha subunit [Xylariaceae sp. AK1471]
MEGLLDFRSSTLGPDSPPSTVSRVNQNQGDVVLQEDARRNPQTGVMIAKIEEILAAMIDALKENRVLTIPLRSRATGRDQLVRFPSSRDTEVKKFTALLQILHLSHEALVAGTVITKRGIYYQNPDLFGSQQYIDSLVDDVAFTFGLGRDALNIVATSKGLIAGAVDIKIDNGSIFHCNPDDSQGVLLPAVRDSIVDIGATKWILVIEKEATFRGLVASRFHETAIMGPGVLITAKGYPDLSTRQFLHALHTKFPWLPMYALVDFDPDGVSIMLTYKNGSLSLQHEANATMNRLVWIGPKSDDVLGHYNREAPPHYTNQSSVFALTRSQQSSLSQSSALSSSNCAGDFIPVEGTLPLKTRDRRLAVRLLATAAGNDDRYANGLDFIRELQVMLLLNTKAEIQAVDEAGDLTAWLDSALVKNMNGI